MYVFLYWMNGLFIHVKKNWRSFFFFFNYGKRIMIFKRLRMKLAPYHLRVNIFTFSQFTHTCGVLWFSFGPFVDEYFETLSSKKDDFVKEHSLLKLYNSATSSPECFEIYRGPSVSLSLSLSVMTYSDVCRMHWNS